MDALHYQQDRYHKSLQLDAIVEQIEQYELVDAGRERVSIGQLLFKLIFNFLIL